MTNSYFNHDNPLTRHTLGRAEEVNNIFNAVEAGFDLLPDADDFGENQYVQDTGAANAYVVTLDPNPLSYYEGLRLLMKAANANTAASTINVNGIGVKTIKRYNGDDLQVNDITAGMIVYLIYDGTNFRIVSAHGADVALAQAWATSTSVVSGGLKGARGYAQDASTSAGAAASSASSASTSAANALSSYQSFLGTYYGPLSSDPALDPLGNALGAGDLYLNTLTGQLRVYSGSAWSNVTSLHTHAASDITSGTFDNARIAQSSVTQHQAALSIARSQLTVGTGALVYSHVNLSISNATNTMLTFDSEVYDDANVHSTSSNTSRLTVPSGVNRVVISAGISHLGSTSTNSSFRMTLYKNGSMYTPQVHSQTHNAATNSATYRQELVSPPIPVSAGDYFEIEVWQNIGGSMTLALDTVWASMEFVQ